MTKSELMNDIFKWGVLAAVVVFIPEMANAQTTIKAGIEGINSDITNLPKLVSGIAYVGGAALVARGALKLKAHAENPAQEKMAPGIASLLAGGGIAALPMLVTTLTNTTQISGNAAYVPLGTIGN